MWEMEERGREVSLLLLLLLFELDTTAQVRKKEGRDSGRSKGNGARSAAAFLAPLATAVGSAELAKLGRCGYGSGAGTTHRNRDRTGPDDLGVGVGVGVCVSVSCSLNTTQW